MANFSESYIDYRIQTSAHKIDRNESGLWTAHSIEFPGIKSDVCVSSVAAVVNLKEKLKNFMQNDPCFF